jgi:hypothetical protein
VDLNGEDRFTGPEPAGARHRAIFHGASQIPSPAKCYAPDQAVFQCTYTSYQLAFLTPGRFPANAFIRNWNWKASYQHKAPGQGKGFGDGLLGRVVEQERHVHDPS